MQDSRAKGSLKSEPAPSPEQAGVPDFQCQYMYRSEKKSRLADTSVFDLSSL
jgi:hypothetical protein